MKLAGVLPHLKFPHLKFRARALYARADAKSACPTFAEVKDYRQGWNSDPLFLTI
jgi:hypothetical protein